MFRLCSIWENVLCFQIFQVERTLRVRGDLHIGGLMIRLVDELGKTHKLSRKKGNRAQSP